MLPSSDEEEDVKPSSLLEASTVTDNESYTEEHGESIDPLSIPEVTESVQPYCLPSLKATDKSSPSKKKKLKLPALIPISSLVHEEDTATSTESSPVKESIKSKTKAKQKGLDPQKSTQPKLVPVSTEDNDIFIDVSDEKGKKKPRKKQLYNKLSWEQIQEKLANAAAARESRKLKKPRKYIDCFDDVDLKALELLKRQYVQYTLPLFK
jgi:hypothetical protein